MNNLKYEGFALLFTPLDNINYCGEPSSLEKGKEKTTLEKLQALQVFKGPSASPPKMKRQARAAVVRIYSADIMATFLLPSQPRTSTKNVRLAILQALLSVGNVVERLFGCVAGPDLPGVTWIFGSNASSALCLLPPRASHFVASPLELLCVFS